MGGAEGVGGGGRRRLGGRGGYMGYSASNKYRRIEKRVLYMYISKLLIWRANQTIICLVSQSPKRVVGQIVLHLLW